MEIHCAYDQLVRVADLKPHPKNPNTHSAAQVAAIAAVIEGNGWRAPITVSAHSSFITRGHGRLEAALLLGCEQVPVDFQDYTSEQAELADMLADNHLAELAGIDEDRLVGVLKELQAASHDVGLVGFTEDGVARLIAVEEEIAQLEPIPKMELQAAAAARRGHAFWDHSATVGRVETSARSPAGASCYNYRKSSSPSPREERAGRGLGRGARSVELSALWGSPLPDPLPTPSSWGEGIACRLGVITMRPSPASGQRIPCQYYPSARKFLRFTIGRERSAGHVAREILVWCLRNNY